jgi:hypothetical protein
MRELEMPPPVCLREKEVRRRLSVGKPYLKFLLAQGRFPRPFTFYDRSDRPLQMWLESDVTDFILRHAKYRFTPSNPFQPPPEQSLKQLRR